MSHISRISVAFAIAVVSTGCSGSTSPTSPSASVLPGAVAAAASNHLAGGPTAAQQLPFRGRLQGTVTLDFTGFPMVDVFIAATGQATQLGQFTLEIPHVVDFQAATGEGTFAFTAANGDTVTATFAGQADTSAPIFVIREVATITGGTGRFVGATGAFIADRLNDTTTNTTSGSFEGTISIPRGASH
jgi:hypothetical protein